MGQLHWFQNDGGPLAVMPRDPAPLWEGGALPSRGRVVHADFRYDGEVATDYDRACDVDEVRHTSDMRSGFQPLRDAIASKHARSSIGATRESRARRRSSGSPACRVESRQRPLLVVGGAG